MRKHTAKVLKINFGNGVGYWEYFAAKAGWAPGGSWAVSVSAPPKGTFILTRPLMAQPLASRIGPRLRWRSLSQAMSIDGVEMRSRMPANARQTCQKGSLRMPER